MNIKIKLVGVALLALVAGYALGASGDDGWQDCHAATIDYSNAIGENRGTPQGAQRQREAFELYKMQCIQK